MSSRTTPSTSIRFATIGRLPLESGPGPHAFRAERTGAVVLATGAVPYDATKLGHLGFGKHKNVITNVTMEELAVKGLANLKRIAAQIAVMVVPALEE